MASERWRVAVTLEAYEVSNDPRCDEAYGIRTLEDEELVEVTSEREARAIFIEAHEDLERIAKLTKEQRKALRAWLDEATNP